MMMEIFIKQLSKSRSFIMGLAMVSIMWFHQGWMHDVVSKGFGFVGHFGVDIFFFVSGFGVVYALRKYNVKSFYLRRIQRLFPSLIIFGICKYLIVKYIGPDVFSGYSVDWTTLLGFDLWYICVLLVFYIISPLIYKFITPIGGWVFLLTLIMLIALGGNYNGFHDTFRWGLVRFPVFLSGMLIADNKLNMSAGYLKYGLIFVLLAALYRLSRVFGCNDATDLYTFLILCLGIPSLCYWLGQLYLIAENTNISRIFIYIGQRSLELYIVHEFIYFLIKYFEIPNFIGFLSAVFVSFIVAELLFRTTTILFKR